MANDTQKKTGGFFQDNKNTLIVAAIVIIVLAVYFSTRDKATTGTQNDRKDTEQSEEMKDESSESMKDEDKMNAEGKPGESNTSAKPSATPTPAATSNVQFTGTLRASSDPAKGNYVVASDRGMIYLKTSRDLSAWMNTLVNIQAEGSISQFTITHIGSAAGSMMEDKGGSSETPAQPANGVSFSGTLQKSSDESKGNYSIASGKTTVYLKTSKDYSSLVGKSVTLEAQGTLTSFHHARVTAQ